MNADDAKNLGIVGAGGAGFPLHVKLRARPDILIVNAVECEPLLHKDKELLRHQPDRIFEGLRLAMECTGAGHGVIAVKAKHRGLIERLSAGVPKNVRIEAVGDFYPAGDELILVHLVTGRVVQPGALPIGEGCLVQNVETLVNLASGTPVTEKWLTVAGGVDRPATIKVPVGTAIRDVLARFTLTVERPVVRSGGLMMGTLESDWNAVVTKTTGGLIVLPGDHPLVQLYARYKTEAATVRLAKAACDQCSFCTDLCPRYLLGHPVRPETAMRNRMFSPSGDGRLHPGNAFCCECNLCTLYACPEGLDPKGAAVIEKRNAQAQGLRWEGLPARPHPLADYRKVPTDRLKQRLGIGLYPDEGPLCDLAVEPDTVRIPMKQHAGAPAVPVVRIGDRVRNGDLIAEASGAVSARVHASLSGRITGVQETEIVISKERA